MIKVLMLLYGCYNYNLNKCYIFYFFCSDSVVYVSKNVKKNGKDIGDSNKYNYVKRGFYRHSTYTVKPGDTLFYIAWISGNNYIDLARSNNIENIHLLKIGQVLKVRSNVIFLHPKKLLKKVFNSISNYSVTFKKIVFLIKKTILFTQIYKKNIFDIDFLYKKNSCLNNLEVVMCHDNWHWPTYGKLIDTFSESEGGNKGIDISGKFGQPILAVTNGRVMYVGNTLKGYGNLIIIKHNNDYLSAYAHNDMILVSEQQRVKIGDKIATMGNSGTDETKLHFEIRHKEKSVNPIYYLPKLY